MPAYAIAHNRSIDLNDEVVRYIAEIDDTIAPYGGRFLVHGVAPIVKEPPFDGHIVIIEFPDVAAAEAWYASDAYQAILPLRTENGDCSAIIVDGVPDGYRAARFLATLGQPAVTRP